MMGQTIGSGCAGQSLVEVLEARRVCSTVYVIHDLGSDVGPSDINDRGQIVGSMRVGGSEGVQRAFLYEPGRGVVELGSAGKGRHLPGAARAINERGTIVGCVDGRAASFSGRKVRWLPERQPKTTRSCAVDVNASGHILVEGSANTADGENAKLGVVKAGKYERLGRGAQGHLIDGGAVLGSLYLQRGKSPIRIFDHDVMSNGGHYVDNPYDLIWRGGARDGRVRLYSVRGEDRHFSLRFADINDTGLAVGTLTRVIKTGFAVYDEPDPFVFSGGRIHNLNSLIPVESEWDLEHAAAVNASGQIVGSGWYKGEWHGFLLTPVAGAAFPKQLLPGDVKLKLISKSGGSQTSNAMSAVVDRLRFDDLFDARRA